MWLIPDKMAGQGRHGRQSAAAGAARWSFTGSKRHFVCTHKDNDLFWLFFFFTDDSKFLSFKLNTGHHCNSIARLLSSKSGLPHWRIAKLTISFFGLSSYADWIIIKYKYMTDIVCLLQEINYFDDLKNINNILKHVKLLYVWTVQSWGYQLFSPRKFKYWFNFKTLSLSHFGLWPQSFSFCFSVIWTSPSCLVGLF